MSTGHDHPTDALAALALGALPAEEAGEVERHLSACSACGEELAVLRVVVDALPEAVEPVSAPDELRGRLMGVVHAEAQLLRAAGSEADVVQVPPRRARWRRFSPVTVGIATATVLAAGALGGFVLRDATNDGGRSSVRATVIEARVAPRLRAHAARARLILRGDRATLSVEHFPTPRRSGVYQVWLQGRERLLRPTTALFIPDKDGHARVEVPGGLRGVSAILVTSEPPGGTPTGLPSHDPIVIAPTHASRHRPARATVGPRSDRV